MGLSMGIVYVPSLALIRHHFRTHHRALALGIATTGSAIGGAIYPIMLNNSINQKGNTFGTGGTPRTFRHAIKENAALNAGLLFLANLLILTRNIRVIDRKSDTRMRESLKFLREPVYLLTCIG